MPLFPNFRPFVRIPNVSTVRPLAAICPDIASFLRLPSHFGEKETRIQESVTLGGKIVTHKVGVKEGIKVQVGFKMRLLRFLSRSILGLVS